MMFERSPSFFGVQPSGVITTLQRNGAMHNSIVVCGAYQANAAFVSVLGNSAEVPNLRRDPRCSVLAVPLDWRSYVAVEGQAQPRDYRNTDSEELRVELRGVSRARGDKEHPDWEDVRPGDAAAGRGGSAGPAGADLRFAALITKLLSGSDNILGGKQMKVGFVGLGSSTAYNTIQAGHELVVHDIRREAATPHLEAGATWADTPRQVAEASDFVFTSLPGPTEVEAVALGEDGLLSGMSAGKVYFDLSTNSPGMIRRIHQGASLQGIQVLDAPVSGGTRGARTRNLAIWVGGDREVCERCKPVLDAIGDKAYYVGPIGCGAVAKLVHNCTGYVFQCALGGILKGHVNSQAVYPLFEQDGLGAQERRYTAHEQGNHRERVGVKARVGAVGGLGARPGSEIDPRVAGGRGGGVPGKGEVGPPV